MELTQQDKAMVFAMYIGSDIKVSDSKKQYNLIGVVRNNCTVIGTQGMVKTSGIDICKLILKDLSDITDEDAIEVGKIFSKNSGTWQQGRGVLHFLLSGNFQPLGGIDFDTITNIIDYLRSKSYMLCCKGINLFDAGIAIRKTKKA